MNTQLVIFDLDDTLLPEKPPVEGAFAAMGLLAKPAGADPARLAQIIQKVARALWYAGPWHPYGTSLGISWWEGLSAGFDGDFPNMPAMKAWCMQYRIDAWRAALAECGVKDEPLALKLAALFPHEKNDRTSVYEGAREVVDEMARQYRVGMITNGVPDLQHEKMRRSRFVGRFDPLVISGELGIGKPDARVFEHLLGRADVKAANAVMVGNSLVSDIAGARNAGVASVWINHDGISAPADCRPTVEIRGIRELPSAIQMLNTR